jgi:hypothetical protein
MTLARIGLWARGLWTVKRNRWAALAALAAWVGASPADAGTKIAIGDKCTTPDSCASGLCGAWDPGTKACLPQPGSAGTGEKCSTNDHCKAGHSCVAHRCEKPLELGEPCAGNTFCASGYCDQGVGSGGTQKCVPPAGTGKTGQYCSQEAHCESKLCLSSKCQSRREPGGECRYNESCMSGHCETKTMTGIGAVDQGIAQGANLMWKCIPRAGTGTGGQYCSKHGQCRSDWCAPKTGCAPVGDLGEACPGGNKGCTSGFCDSGAGSGGTNKCVPPAGTGKPGDYCSQNGHCKPGKSCNAHKCQ